MKRQLIFLSIFFSCIFLCKDLIAQTKKITVTGVVTDAATKETIIGANIYAGAGAKPSRVGSTDARGRFSISVDDGALLTFSYVSYVAKKVQLKPGQTSVNVSLSEDKQVMDEVVIRGYQKRSRELPQGLPSS